MSKATLPKRFYKDVGVSAQQGGYVITLDGRVLKTPGKLTLLCETKRHAELIAREWDSVEAVIDPAAMPLTRLFNVAVERTPVMRDRVVAEVRQYAGGDVLCYRAQTPSALTERQAEIWNPWLDWARGQGIELATTEGIIAIDQSEAALNAVAQKAAALNDLRLTVLGHLTAVYGSAVLALAVVEGELPAVKALDISRLDARFQIERWGEDEEATEIAEATRAEIAQIAQII